MIPYSKLMKKRGCESEFLLYLKMYAFQREDIKFLAKEEKNNFHHSRLWFIKQRLIH